MCPSGDYSSVCARLVVVGVPPHHAAAAQMLRIEKDMLSVRRNRSRMGSSRGGQLACMILRLFGIGGR